MAGHSARVPAALCTTAMSIGATTSERQKAATMAEQASSRNALTAQSTITKTLTVKKLADRRKLWEISLLPRASQRKNRRGKMLKTVLLMRLVLLLLVCLSRSDATSDAPHLRVRPDVEAAIAAGHPVVALESTIITHGMPYPQNLETARAVEQIVREGGAVPATIAILDGECIVGLDDAQLERLAQLGASHVRKCSRRDLGPLISCGGHGATTVSATMVLAEQAGVRVFVTGGIGGVHRGGELSMDVSADLKELGRTPVAVICAGIKSILDIPRTLEVLESEGVPVLTLCSDELPAFFTRHSLCKSPDRVESAAQAAGAIAAQERLGLGCGVLIAVPIPEDAEADAEPVQRAIEQALEEAENGAVGGAATTPFLLQRVNELTHGVSLKANIALIKNNAAVGAQIASELCHIQPQRPASQRPASQRLAPPVAPAPQIPALHTLRSEASRKARPVVIGGAVADLTASGRLSAATSVPGSLLLSAGGVGRNIAEALQRLECSPLFLSAVGEDHLATLVEMCGSEGMAAAALGEGLLDACVRIEGERTATYTALVHSAEDDATHGEMQMAVADMDVLRHVSPGYIEQFGNELSTAPLTILDANLGTDALRTAIRLARPQPAAASPHSATASLPSAARTRGLIWLEPVSVPKGVAAFWALRDLLSEIDFVSPNEMELIAMASAAEREALGSELDARARKQALEPDEATLRRAAATLVRCGVRHVVTTRGAKGLLWARAANAAVALGADCEYGCEFEYLEAPLVDTVVDTRGAGDCFVAGAGWALLNPHSNTCDVAAVRSALRAGLRAAQLTVLSEQAVSRELCHDRLLAMMSEHVHS